MLVLSDDTGNYGKINVLISQKIDKDCRHAIF
jgi:hypothetical protein